MTELPSGTVTFLFSDVEGSTEMLYRLGDDRGTGAIAEHAGLLRDAFAHWGGREVDTQGDAFFVAFPRASDAISAAAEAQRSLAAGPWPGDAPVRVRMALLTGEANVSGNGYAGIDVHRAARICAAGHGGQVLVAHSTSDLVSDKLPADLSLRDLGEHRLKDLQRREHIYQLVIAGLPAEFPPLRTLDVLPNNLPLQLTSFVGREEEMVEVKRLLAGTRLLTLTGPGGTGKTRLALQVAADRLDDFPDGVWLVELAPITNPEAISAAVAGTLGVRELPDFPLWDGLLNYLREKRTLLILDNCEHLIQAASRFTDELLHVCAELTILATSREALGIAGETSYRVPSLPLPDGPYSAEAVRSSAAVRLFMERASAVLPSFVFTDAIGPAVVGICRRLDGIPLAIELAAARTRAFSVEQIAARLDDRFRVLTGGSRTALPRHQTLRALIDWSYELLSPPERSLLCRLSVFAGGWSFEAAEQVCDDLDVLDLLPKLVDKSLVSLDEGGQRYRMLETIRQYALDRLLESGDAAVARDRHLAFYLALVEEAAPALLGPEAKTWLGRLDADFDNIRTSVEWAEGTDPDVALRLIGALKDYFGRRYRSLEGYRWCQQVLKLTDGPAGPGREWERLRGRADVLLTSSMMSINLADNAGAMAAGSESAALWRTLGETLPRVRALSMQALAAAFLDQAAVAISLAGEALEIARAHPDPDPLSITFALTVRARLAVELEHDLSTARLHLEEASKYAGAARYDWGIAMQSMGLGLMAARGGDYSAAQSHFRNGMELFEAEGDHYFANVMRSELADADRKSGQMEDARQLFVAALPEWQRVGNRGAVARILECFGFLARARAYSLGPGPERDRLLERMARLCGAAEALRELAGTPMMSFEQAEYEAEIEAGRAAMPAEAWDAAWASGRALNTDEAIAYALEEG